MSRVLREVTVENRKSPFPSHHLLFALALLLSLALFGTGVYLAVQHGGWALLAAGGVSIIVVLVAWPIGNTLATARAEALGHQTSLQTTLGERLEEMSIIINLVSEQQLLSDRAKAVAFREKDRDALRRAIREEMAKRDWEAALALADDMGTVFGYRQEAENFRDEIHRASDDVVHKQITDVVTVIDRHTRGEDWGSAHREADKLLRIFPSNDQVKRLPQEIEGRRAAFKSQLLDSWHDAINRHDNEGSIEILKQLDSYLTPAEAEPMQETVRNIFRERLNNLRTQFTIAFQDNKFPEALRLAETIISEHPNAKIAEELREKLPALRKRASEAGGANLVSTT